MALSERPEDTHAWINHYWYKSAEEFIFRRSASTGGQAFSAMMVMPDHVAEGFLKAYEMESIRTDDRLQNKFSKLYSKYKSDIFNKSLIDIEKRILHRCAEISRGIVEHYLQCDEPIKIKLAEIAAKKEQST